MGGAARCGALAGSTSSSSASSSIQLSSMDEDEWEATYGISPLQYGISLQQGVRETMEDAAQVVPHGRYGFFFASEPPAACCSVSAVTQCLGAAHANRLMRRHRQGPA